MVGSFLFSIVGYTVGVKILVQFAGKRQFFSLKLKLLEIVVLVSCKTKNKFGN